MRPSLEDQCIIIGKRNKSLIIEVIQYILKSFDISFMEFRKNMNRYVNDILSNLKCQNGKAALLRIHRKKLRDDLNDLQYTKKYGLSKMNIEKLEKELGELVVETELLEKTLHYHNKLIINLIDLIPQPSYRIPMRMTFIECMNQSEIAKELLMEPDGVRNARFRGIKMLCGIISAALNDNALNVNKALK